MVKLTRRTRLSVSKPLIGCFQTVIGRQSHLVAKKPCCNLQASCITVSSRWIGNGGWVWDRFFARQDQSFNSIFVGLLSLPRGRMVDVVFEGHLCPSFPLSRPALHTFNTRFNKSSNDIIGCFHVGFLEKWKGWSGHEKRTKIRCA